jgi:hypothetical protein
MLLQGRSNLAARGVACACHAHVHVATTRAFCSAHLRVSVTTLRVYCRYSRCGNNGKGVMRRRQTTSMQILDAPRLYQALREMLRFFPSWANPKTGSAPANGVDTTPRRCASVNGGDQIRARAFDPAPVHTPGDRLTAGIRELRTLAEGERALIPALSCRMGAPPTRAKTKMQVISRRNDRVSKVFVNALALYRVLSWCVVHISSETVTIPS